MTFRGHFGKPGLLFTHSSYTHKTRFHLLIGLFDGMQLMTLVQILGKPFFFILYIYYNFCEIFKKNVGVIMALHHSLLRR